MNKKMLFFGILIIVLNINCSKKDDEGKAPTSAFKVEESTIYVFEEAVFTDISGFEPVQWYWDFGDGNTSTDQNPKHRYMEIGLHKVILTVSNVYGEDTKMKLDYIEVIPYEPPGFEVSDRIVSINETVIFTDTSIFDGIQWSWDFGDGKTSIEQIPEHTYSEAGIYAVTLSIANEYGEITNTIENSVKVFNELVYDIDSNKYGVVEIGQQFWLAQNLASTKLNNGDEIEFVKSSSETIENWESRTTPAYCWYNDDEGLSMKKDYGAMYNYKTVGTEKVCPEGWHVSNYGDWSILQNFLTEEGFADIEGVALKANVGWDRNRGEDLFMFSAVPAGYLFNNINSESSNGAGCYTTWWLDSKTSGNMVVRNYGFNCQVDLLLKHSIDSKDANGRSIRCVRD